MIDWMTPYCVRCVAASFVSAIVFSAASTLLFENREVFVVASAPTFAVAEVLR